MKETVFFGTSDGPVAAFGLIPKAIMQSPATMAQQSSALTIEGYTTIAPVVIYYYQIYQQVGGTAIALLFFDRADVPANGTALTDAEGFVFAQPISNPGSDKTNASVLSNLEFPGHRYNNGFVVVGSTSDTQVTLASEKLLVSVTYGPYNVG